MRGQLSRIGQVAPLGRCPVGVGGRVVNMIFFDSRLGGLTSCPWLRVSSPPVCTVITLLRPTLRQTTSMDESTGRAWAYQPCA